VEALTLEDIHDAARILVGAPRTLSVVGTFDESAFDAVALSLG
jgi:D-aminopeptidase